MRPGAGVVVGLCDHQLMSPGCRKGAGAAADSLGFTFKAGFYNAGPGAQ